MKKEAEGFISTSFISRRKLLIGSAALLTSGLLSKPADAMVTGIEGLHNSVRPPKTFMYHDINTPRNSAEEMNWIPVKKFRNQIEQLVATGLRFGTLSEALQDPENVIALTFDDGIHTAYDLIYPFLKSQGIRATFFIPVASILSKNKYFMTPSQVKELSDAGFQISSHSYNHIMLTTRNNNELKFEVSKSKEWLEDLTGRAVEFLAYPGGDYNQKVAYETFLAGYKAAFISRDKRALNLEKSLEEFELPRYWMTEQTDLSKIFPKPPPLGVSRLIS